MKLTKQEYQELIDSRLVDLQNEIETYLEQVSIVTTEGGTVLADNIVYKAQLLKEAHEALEEAEVQEQIDEAEEEYKKQFGEE